MKLKTIAVAWGVVLAACAVTPSDTATMPLNSAGGPKLNQTEAIGLAGWALSDPANTAGNPEAGARAVAAEEWLAGQTTLYGTFEQYAPATELSWALLRQQVRAAIGVSPGASSQEIVNRLLAAADALAAGNVGQAEAQLAAPVFSLGPDRTLQVLTNLPTLPASNQAFADLRRNGGRSGGGPSPK